jgi:hypothetical protein
MNKYQLIEVDTPAVWNQFVDSSPQGTIFSYFEYLTVAVQKFKLYWICKGIQHKAGVVLILNEDDTICMLDDLVIYGGILFAQDNTQKEVKARYERFEITEFLIEELVAKYDKIELALSPHFEDMRPFLWHNYHSDNIRDKFQVNLRYTSYLDISELAFCKAGSDEDTLIFKSLETKRQRNIRQARKNGAEIVSARETGVLVDFYRCLMQKQGENVGQEKLERMSLLIDCLLEKKMAMLTMAKNSEGQAMYMTFFVWDKNRAYYLFGAGNPDAGEKYKGTIAFWDSFKLLAKEYGIKSVDMEGINSPHRGWFKLGFGGSMISYFEVCRGKS